MKINLNTPLSRITIIGIFFVMVYSVLVFKLWNVQIKSGEEYRKSISKQSIRQIRLPAVRGRIYSSDGSILADNEPSYNVNFHLEEMRQPGRRSKTVKHIIASAGRIAELLDRENTLTKGNILNHMNYRPGLPMTVFKKLSKRELGTIAELSPAIKGVEVVVVPVRRYPEGKVASHILGYTRLDDPQKADDRKSFFYYVPDQVGKSGLEKRYDKEIPEASRMGMEIRGMRGTPGRSIVRVDHLGYIYETIGANSEPLIGHDIVLTIDLKAQKIAEQLLEGKNGSVVVLDAATGAVLVMASSPAFNLHDFTPGLSSKKWRELQSNPDRPMVNRAVLADTPGSIIKPLTALALLENGKDPEEVTLCDGASYIGNARIRCWSWRRGGHGSVNLYNALEQSCNDYFIENGCKLGLEAISKTLKSAGIGQNTGFPLPEYRGILPSRETKMAKYGQRWNAYDTALISMGQGIVTLSPLQAAVYTAAIANGGKVWKPYLLKEVLDRQGNVLFKHRPEKAGELDASVGNLAIIRKGMWMVVHSPSGSAKRARNSVITLSGKTGTAEKGPRSNRVTDTRFIAFGKHKGRLYAIAVFVEKGVSGGRTCAPIASLFFERWLGEGSVK